MLNSCAAGVTTVNIDNGFSAAVTAVLINKKISDTNLHGEISHKKAQKTPKKLTTNEPD